MEKKRWLTGRKVAGIVFLLFLIDVSCFGAWWAISHPPEKRVLPEGVRIGLAIDTTHYSGKHMLMGAQMAADEINELGTGGPLDPGEKGGVLVGKERLPIVIVEEDSQELSPDVGTERTVAAVTKLITTYGVDVVIGGYATAMVILETCARYKTIFINAGTSANSVTETVIANYDKYKYIFSSNRNSTVLGMYIADFYAWLKDNYGFTKVAIIAEEYTWCDPIIAYVEEHFPALGIDIVYKVRFPSTTTTFFPYLSDAQDDEAQVILPIIALDWGITFVKEWAAMEYGLSAGFIIAGERSTFWEETDGAAEYHIEVRYPLPMSNVTDWSYTFHSSFKKRYGEFPMYCARTAYSAVYAYCRAVERAGTLESDAVVVELEKTDMPTPYSRLKFLSCHTPRAGNDYWPAMASQWMGSEYRPSIFCSVTTFLTDEPIVYATLTLPPWLE